ncbi:MAG: exodeoxyribonuclease VII small subunit [Ruminococcus sp.]|nr:exodeoxyribonuclease VII small subunit [Ruminococcus sp.]
MSFEVHFKELQELTLKLEKEDLPLEEAVKLYEKGMLLAANCQEELQNAKLQMTKESAVIQHKHEGEQENGTEE